MATGRVLVVDDERFFRELFTEQLAGTGLIVRSASSGEEALERLAEDRVDVLLTDMVMPGMDGIQLVREALKKDPELEAVAITGKEDVRLAVAAMKAGCVEFLQKPVEAEDLRAVIEKVMARVLLRREHAQLRSENAAFAQAQALARRGLKLLATLDLERLQDLALQILAEMTDAQGAALWIADDRGALTLRGYRGLVDRAAIPIRIDPREPPWAGVLAGSTPAPAPGAAPGQAFALPLKADDELVGLALLTDRASGRFGMDDQAAAQAVADFAALAVRNARRFGALERVGLRDRETGAYNLAYFVDYAGKEFYKARRYGRGFSLVLLSVDNVEQVRAAGGRELYRRVMRDLVTATSRVVRDADILARVGEGEYYVLLPETDAFGALMFQRRAAEEIRSEASVRQLEERVPLRLSAGAGTFPRDGEDFDQLLHWARERREAQRGSLLRRLQVDDQGRSAFWELVDLLLAGDLPVAGASPSARTGATPQLFEAIQREAAREIGRDPRARGLLFVGVRGGLARAAVLEGLPPGDPAARSGDATVRVYLLGPRAGAEGRVAHPLVAEVFLDGDARFKEHQFLLLLSEHAAYAWLEGPGGRTFHSSDVSLVDGLVARLQALYDLQPV